MGQTLGAMVVCPEAQASAVGAAILRQGGSAVDGAIAIQAALCVTYPHMTGLGGDAFWLVQPPGESPQGLNGSGRSGAQVTVEAFQSRGLTAIPQRGPLAAITVPGAVDSWHQAHQRWGRLPWAQVLAPAIALAQEGFAVSGSLAHWSRLDQPVLAAHNPQGCPYLPEGNPLQPGQWLIHPALAHTLETLAQEGSASFYTGPLAQAQAQHLASLGGLLTPADWAAHRSTWVSPIATTYRDHQVYTLPPNSQGFTLLEALNILAGDDLAALGHGTVDYYHLGIEALKLAMADRDRWLGDPTTATIPLEMLISPAYGQQQRQRLSLDRAGDYQPGALGGGTAYTAVVDREGLAVSVIQSVFFDFGSGVMVPETGILLQNRGASFRLEGHDTNTLAPGKYPFHTLMPSLVTRQGRPYLVLGTMGGEGQPQTQVALLTRLLDFAMEPQAAIDAPRWLWGRTWGETTLGLTLEGRIPGPVRQALAARGHDPIRVVPDWSAFLGHAHCIRIDPTTGMLSGGCDRRSDGAAIVIALP